MESFELTKLSIRRYNAAMSFLNDSMERLHREQQYSDYGVTARRVIQNLINAGAARGLAMLALKLEDFKAAGSAKKYMDDHNITDSELQEDFEKIMSTACTIVTGVKQ